MFSEKIKLDLLLICKYMEIKHVFTIMMHKQEVGLHIADDEDGNWDFDNGLRWVNYDKSLDALAPVAQKVIKRLGKLEVISSVTIVSSKCLERLHTASIAHDPAQLFPAVIEGITIINDFDARNAQDK